jgi:hypothetical protein
MISGLSADEAINTLRTKRSSYALCNSDYERWLLSEADETLKSLKNTKKKVSSYSL